ncbi:MAG: ImmA/IrrE family metallo-endopeptidase [Candidatus Pacebacteria bacterium]|nr:ImmA/IrrE family metallo-endopeptidase [Candidatus Paceibacterota bacterium]
MSFVKSINVENLRIARKNMGLGTLSATKGISKSSKNLVAEWESGDSLPTWIQVNKLAKLYNISELLFFSKNVLKKSKIIPDYRVGSKREDDYGVKKLINLVLSRQKWLEKDLKSEGVPRNNLQGSGKNIQNPRKLADLILRKLEVNLEEFKNISGYGARRNALKYLIKKAENKGIFVGKTISYHNIDVDDMRGLFISNDYCPYIVLNRKDALSAQIFSFIHELAHLFRKSDAISNSLDFRATNRNIDSEEVFCNRVAAEFLLPQEEFSKEIYNNLDINEISERYKVSKIFIFYRLKDLNKIAFDQVEELEQKIRKETEDNILLKNKPKTKGGNYTTNMKDSNGNLFNRIISKSYYDNKINYTEASKLLKFSAENL